MLRQKLPLLGVCTAVFVSGAAGLINQVAWQRGLKIFLGGSETLSTMTVVLVFLGGLGIGAAWAARVATKWRSAVVTLLNLELALCVINWGIAELLRANPVETVTAWERAALTVGLPLRGVYLLSAILVLGAPCTLMGMTLPAASEVLERHLGCKNRSWLGGLCGINTLGAVCGAVLAGFVLLPQFGQFRTLLAAVLGNLLAALLVAWFTRNVGEANRPVSVMSQNGQGLEAYATESVVRLGFLFGLLALAHEMYLFRMLPLLYWPLPETFSLALACYLGSWSLGALAVSIFPNRLRPSLTLTAMTAAVLIGLTPPLYAWHRWQCPQPQTVWKLFPLYFAPCFCFGALYSQLIGRWGASGAHAEWGNASGRFNAWNTAGSCGGVLLFTLVGYEMDQNLTAWIIVLGLLIAVAWLTVLDAPRNRSFVNIARSYGVAALAIALAALTVYGLRQNLVVQKDGTQSYYGRDGVVEIRPNGLMIWDGLEHAGLRQGENQIGDNNWLMAAIPVLAHPARQLDRALVIGLGCGTTAHTLAGVDRIKSVEVYEINETLKRLLRDNPDGTFDVATDPKIQIRWQDGRTGLALSEQTYDLITQQPLWLMQAGSGLLLSREYFELVRSRLTPRGVFCVYTYDGGNGAQSQIVRQTLQQVFPHCESFFNGWMVLASQQPLDLEPARWRTKSSGSDRFSHEIAAFEQIRSFSRLPPLTASRDVPRLSWKLTEDVTTDDHPLVEFPREALSRVRASSHERLAVAPKQIVGQAER